MPERHNSITGSTVSQCGSSTNSLCIVYHCWPKVPVGSAGSPKYTRKNFEPISIFEREQHLLYDGVRMAFLACKCKSIALGCTYHVRLSNGR
jgi:hypothetical protein